MSSAKFVNIARLMTTYNFEIEQLPDNLKCRKCKLLLKDACLVSCGCTFCRICIDNMMSSGVEFCPGDSESCGESSLSCFLSDFRANNIISRLIAKCPHNGCMHECQLANMEEHLQECQRRIEEHPFSELGCTRDNLAADDMNGHLQQENRGYSEILIGMVANINREIEMLKQRDEDSRREIDMMKQRDEDSRKEIGKLKHDLVLKDGQIRTIFDQMIHLENENKSLAQGKEDLANQVRILQEKIEREIDERRDSDELDSARLVEHIDKEIAAITVMIGSNKNELVTDMSSVRDDIRAINQGVESISDDIDSMNKKIELMQELVGQVDARCELEIVEDLIKVTWTDAAEVKKSAISTGAVHLYKYQLSAINYSGRYPCLQIHLRIHFGPNDEQLVWPFCGRVVITVADRDRREACKTISQQCTITRPTADIHSASDPFRFYHTELISAKLDLSRGVHVSCVIVPGTGR